MEHVLLWWGVVSGAAMSMFAIVIYPRVASRLNDSLPRNKLARRLATWPLRDVRFDSPENIAQARACGVLVLILTLICLATAIGL
jgi:hypothetical protein